MVPPITNPMVRGENKSRLLIAIKLIDNLRDLLNTLIDNLDIPQILLRIRPMRMSRRIQAKHMQEKHNLILPQPRIQLFVCVSILE